MLVMFAALQSIPEYVYEAAKMDGLSGWQIFWRVTLPLLKPAIGVVLILRGRRRVPDDRARLSDDQGRTRRLHRGAALVHLLTGFQNSDLGYAAAQAVVMLIIVMIVAQIFVRRLEYREATA